MMQIFENTEIEDKNLISDALGGSKTALEHLISRHYNFIYNVSLRFLLSPDDAKDLTQEVVIQVITKLSQFNGKSEFRTWLYRIVFNHFLNSKRRSLENAIVSFEDYGKELDKIPLEELNEEEALTQSDLVKEAKFSCMFGMLICLERKQRLVYILGEIFEVNSKIGAKFLDISPENFRKILSRSRKELYNFMNEKCGLQNKNNPCRCSKKTKGFIKAGWVNPEKLQFNNDFLKEIAEILPEKINECDNLMEEKYSALFKESPFYQKDKSKELISELTNDNKFRDVFNLE